MPEQTITSTKIINGKISLPENIFSVWEQAEVFVLPSDDTLIVKRINPSQYSLVRDRLKSIGKSISQKDINDAIKQARKKVYKSSA